MTFQVIQLVKNPPANAGDARITVSIPGLGRSPGVGNGNPFQYSCLENSRGRGAWWATVHGTMGCKELDTSEHTTHTWKRITGGASTFPGIVKVTPWADYRWRSQTSQLWGQRAEGHFKKRKRCVQRPWVRKIPGTESIRETAMCGVCWERRERCRQAGEARIGSRRTSWGV